MIIQLTRIHYFPQGTLYKNLPYVVYEYGAYYKDFIVINETRTGVISRMLELIKNNV